MDLSGSWEYIEQIARSRLATNKTERHIASYGDGLEIMGAAGELAARRFLGLDEELHTGFDGGIEFEYAGVTVDVKTTLFTPRLEHRFLQYPFSKPLRADIVLMVAVEPQEKMAAILGYATRHEVLSRNVNRKRAYPCREVPVCELKPGWMLLKKHVQETRQRQYA